jgi:hypothetical protein
MRYIVRKSYVIILGYIWMPHVLCSLRVDLSSYDLENMRDEDGHITRESIEQWLTAHSGDFSEVVDFSASIEDGDHTLDFPWSSEETQCQYFDTLAETQ